MFLFILISQFFIFTKVFPGIIITSILILSFFVFGSLFFDLNKSHFIKRIFSNNISKFQYIFAFLLFAAIGITSIEFMTFLLSYFSIKIGFIPSVIKYSYADYIIEGLAQSFTPIVTLFLNNILLDTIGLSYTELITFIENNPSIIQIAELIDNINQFIYYIAFTNIDKTFMGGLIEVSGALNSDHYHDAANPITIFFNSNEMLTIYFDVNVTTSEIENVYINVSNEVFGKLIVNYFELKTGNIIDVPLVIDNDYLYLNISSDYAISIQIKQTYLVNQILEIILILPLSVEDYLVTLLYSILESSGIYPFVEVYSSLINFSLLFFIFVLFIYSLFTMLFTFFLISIFKSKQVFNFFTFTYLLFFLFFSGGLIPAFTVSNGFITFLSTICPHTYMVHQLYYLSTAHVHNYLDYKDWIKILTFAYIFSSFFMFILVYYQLKFN